MLGKKRLIIFILTLLFSFNSFFYSPKADVIEFTNEDYSLEQYSMIDPREPITLTSGLVLAIATLLSACGIAITSSPMAKDMAQRVFDKVKDIPGAITRVGDKIKFNLVKGVLEAVKGVVADLPKNTTSAKDTTDLTSSTSANTTTLKSLGKFYNTTSRFYFTVPKTFTSTKFKIRIKGDKMFMAGVLYPDEFWDIGFYSKTIPAGTYRLILGGDRYEYGDLWIVDANGKDVGRTATGGYSAKYIDIKSLEITDSSYLDETFKVVNSVDIPYSPDTTKDVDYNTRPLEWLPNLSNPVFGGSISVPMNQPLPNISVDAPITSPNDLIADNDISIDATDTTIPDNSVDSDSVLDRILSSVTGFFDGFFDTLGSLLAGLLAPIIALLELLKGALQSVIDFLKSILSAITSGIVSGITSLADLLQSILDFLLSLVVSLVDALVVALEGLFVPTIDLSKAFELPDNIFLPFHEFGFDNLLNIKPKPIRYDTVVRFGSVTYPIKIHFDEISVISNNITLIRNLFSYTLLLITINLAIAVHLPRKVMD